MKISPAQRHALRMIYGGEVTRISELDLRVFSSLTEKGLIVWQQDLFDVQYGRIDRNATLGRAKSGGINL